MDMKRILQAMDGVSTKPVEGANDMSRFLRVVDEAAMYGAGNTGVKTAPQSASQLSSEQVKQLAPYLETDPADGSKYYDLPATDPKEIGAVMGTMIKSPAYIASRKQEQGMVIQQLLALQDPKNHLKPDETTWQPASDEETAQALGFMKEHSLDKFLSIVKKNDVKILNEGANPHKVSLPVQMAMQHYQKKEEKMIQRPVGRESVIGKYFHKVEEEVSELQTSKRQLINQYASTIAERVMMREGKKDKVETIAKRKALQSIDSTLYRNSDKHHHVKTFSEEVVTEKSKTEKQARFMAVAAHDPAFAAKTGIKQSVAKEFNKADTGTKQLSNAMKHKPKKKKQGFSENEIPGHSMGFKPGPGGPGIQSNVAEAPIEMTGDANDPMVYGHDKANPMSLKGRIMQARAQLKELAQLAESDSLLAWEEICKKAKGGMFMGLEQNLEQIRHGINELAKKRKQGGVASRGIDKNIGEAKKIKPKKKTDPCWDNYHQVGVKQKDGNTVPNCVRK